MIFLFCVKIISGTIAKGRPKLKTTWLMTRVRVGSSPMAITAIEGTMVTSRLSHTGTCLWRNPCMITWPALVPTVEEDKPEARREIAKIQLAALPNNGCKVM